MDMPTTQRGRELQLECLQVLRLHLLPCRAYAARVPGATLGPLLGFCRGFLQSLEPSAEGRTFFSPASSVLQLALEIERTRSEMK